MPSFLTPYINYIKVALAVVYTIFIWHSHTIYDESKLTKTEEKQVVKAQTGETKQIEYQQVIQKIYVKDACSDVLIPTATLQLLK